MEKKTADIITYISLAVIVISLAFITTNVITGRVTDTGIVNITILSSASINFSDDIINFGYGIANDTGNPAQLMTNESGRVWYGDNWTTESSGFNITNLGNVRLQVNITSNVSAAELIGGVDAKFQYMVDNATHSGSCPNATYPLSDGTWVNFTYSGSPEGDIREICSDLGYQTNNNSVIVDVFLQISTAATPGDKQALITATGTSL